MSGSSPTPCTCFIKSASTKSCTNCGRHVCAWHRALSPVAIEGQVALVPICHPVCDAPFWADRSRPLGFTP